MDRNGHQSGRPKTSSPATVKREGIVEGFSADCGAIPSVGRRHRSGRALSLPCTTLMGNR
jgi:hypothetical protein